MMKVLLALVLLVGVAECWPVIEHLSMPALSADALRAKRGVHHGKGFFGFAAPALKSHGPVDFDPRLPDPPCVWTAWSGCDAACNGGSAFRNRRITDECAYGPDQQLKACNTQPCFQSSFVVAPSDPVPKPLPVISNPVLPFKSFPQRSGSGKGFSSQSQTKQFSSVGRPARPPRPSQPTGLNGQILNNPSGSFKIQQSFQPSKFQSFQPSRPSKFQSFQPSKIQTSFQPSRPSKFSIPAPRPANPVFIPRPPRPSQKQTFASPAQSKFARPANPVFVQRKTVFASPPARKVIVRRRPVQTVFANPSAKSFSVRRPVLLTPRVGKFSSPIRNKFIISNPVRNKFVPANPVRSKFISSNPSSSFKFFPSKF